MTEIGGYLDFERYEGREYYTNLLRFNTVRNAILFTIKEKRYQKVWLPRYLCCSIRNRLEQSHIKYDYYDITDTLAPDFHGPLSQDEVLLVVNYFGQFNNAQLRQLQKIHKNIIVDNTQSFFQHPSPGIDTVYTCRKYFGVADGAYLHLTIPSMQYDELPNDASYHRMLHLLGRFEKDASDFYPEFCKVDKSFEHEDIKKMSTLTQNILRSIDYDKIVKKRSTNFDTLHRALALRNKLNIYNKGGLYMYPYLTDRGEQIKRDLVTKRIYVPTLWPNVLHDCSADSYEYYLAQNIVLLPIDQRYTVNDMNYMLTVLDKILEKAGDKNGN